MCDTCGCGDTSIVPVEIHETILADNDRVAAHNREHFRAAGVTAINLMGSPGAGKTALLEATAHALVRRHGAAAPRMGALSGDLATDNDALRLQGAGIDSRSITTGSACHLDARMVHDGLHEIDWRSTGFFFIENVGNLVCPAIYDLGQDANVVCLSVTEGEDKPLKYPVMFRNADLVVLTKIDLEPHLAGFEFAELEDALARVMPSPRMIRTAALSEDGIDEWLEWLTNLRSDRAGAQSGHTHAAH